MEAYTLSSQRASEVVTRTFSSSFSSAVKLFDKSIQQDIYNIYGLVRVADEVVDTYQKKGSSSILNSLEKEVYLSIARGFSSNIIVHAFCITANKYSIDRQLIEAFFESMRMDLTKKTFTQKQYKQYIYGSAEVIGLMCLNVFTLGDASRYIKLSGGAAALGSAFQKVNFLRDIKDDYETRGRYYFPKGSFQEFNEEIKLEIIYDIEKDFKKALPAIEDLPESARFATQLAFEYYSKLLIKLKITPASEICKRRVSINKLTKLRLLLSVKIKSYVK